MITDRFSGRGLGRQYSPDICPVWEDGGKRYEIGQFHGKNETLAMEESGRFFVERGRYVGNAVPREVEVAHFDGGHATSDMVDHRRCNDLSNGGCFFLSGWNKWFREDWSEIRPLVDDDADDLSSQFGHFANCLSINDKKTSVFSRGGSTACRRQMGHRRANRPLTVAIGTIRPMTRLSTN